MARAVVQRSRRVYSSPVLGASSYSYAEATSDEQLANWIARNSQSAWIDESKAEEAHWRTEARLHEKLSAEEVATTNAALARSLAQLTVKRRRRGL